MKVQDLRNYTGETGGSHGLDDVSRGVVYLDGGWNLPHCKYHGAMLKVSKDGIWRCWVTDAFQRYPVKNPGEMVLAHGCYYDNRAN